AGSQRRPRSRRRRRRRLRAKRMGLPYDCSKHPTKEGRMEGTCQRNGLPASVPPKHLTALATCKPYDLSGVVTYDLVSRPSKVFHDELGQPVPAETSLGDWLDSLPRQVAANDLRRVSEHLARAARDGRIVGA